MVRDLRYMLAVTLIFPRLSYILYCVSVYLLGLLSGGVVLVMPSLVSHVSLVMLMLLISAFV
jgi:hypothetical protein